MKTNHTKGPLKSIKMFNDYYVIDKDENGIAHICNNEHSEANAKLIAAAPDMIDTLINEVDIIERNLKVLEESETEQGLQIFYKGQLKRFKTVIKKATE